MCFNPLKSIVKIIRVNYRLKKILIAKKRFILQYDNHPQKIWEKTKTKAIFIQPLTNGSQK